MMYQMNRVNRQPRIFDDPFFRSMMGMEPRRPQGMRVDVREDKEAYILEAELPGVKLEDITEIYSHQQAIGQCSKFLNSLNGVRVIPCDNTAMAAKMVAESGNHHAAAISSHPCAALYGLEMLNDNIQDSDNNYTRFICVSKDPIIYAGANRISLILAFENKPGALYEMLSKLAALDINMTKLESCPVAGSDFEFIFFLELDASVHDPSVVAMLEEMERSCASFHFLGNYAEV